MPAVTVDRWFGHGWDRISVVVGFLTFSVSAFAQPRESLKNERSTDLRVPTKNSTGGVWHKKPFEGVITVASGSVEETIQVAVARFLDTEVHEPQTPCKRQMSVHWCELMRRDQPWYMLVLAPLFLVQMDPSNVGLNWDQDVLSFQPNSQCHVASSTLAEGVVKYSRSELPKNGCVLKVRYEVTPPELPVLEHRWNQLMTIP